MKSLSPDTRAQPNRCGALFVSGERVRTAHPCQPLDALPFHRSPGSQPTAARHAAIPDRSAWFAGIKDGDVSLPIVKDGGLLRTQQEH